MDKNERQPFNVVKTLVVLAIIVLFSGWVSGWFDEFLERFQPEETCLTSYPDCHPWQEASHYAGMGPTCFVGRINKVFHYRDEASGYPVWTAYFDPRAVNWTVDDVRAHTIGLVLIEVERSSLPNYEGQCVKVSGEVLLPPQGFNYVPRSMVDADPYSGGGFIIWPCPCPDGW